MPRRAPAPRKGDAEILRSEAEVRAALTPAEVELLDGVRDVLRRRTELRLAASPADPPPLPGTPAEREALREKVTRLSRTSPAPARRPRASADDFEDLGPADVEAELGELI